jgi:2-haloacid dehalogenase
MMPVLTFDLNGTLTDTAALNPFFAATFGTVERRQEWFAQLIELAMTCAATGQFIPFAKLADAALHMLGRRHRVTITEQHAADFIHAVRHLPVFPDVPEGLAKLRDADFRLFVLTNSARATGEYTLDRAGVLHYFERVLSVETPQCYKPLPQVYRFAARHIGIAPKDIMMVAAHNWDTTGAIRAGCRAAFLTRPGEVLAVTDPRPEIIAADLLDLATQVAHDKNSPIRGDIS